MNQPGITKLVMNLTAKSALSSQEDEFDKRKRRLSNTKQGLHLCNEVMHKLQPDISMCLSEWNDQELQQLLENNEKLMTWLDNNRL